MTQVSATSSSGVCFFPGFPGLCVSLLASLSASSCCSESEDSEIRICEFIPATACVLSRVFFLYSESISGLDALHKWVCAHLANRASFISTTDFFFAGS